MDENEVVYIYVLIDPRTSEIRYVGKTNNPKKRLGHHCAVYRDGLYYKERWIRDLRVHNLKPIMEVVDECNSINWEEREKYWIQCYRDLGYRLTNLTSGGYESNDEIRKKISAGLRGKVSSEQKKLRSSLSQPHQRAIYQFSLDGILLNKFRNSRIAVDTLGLREELIRRNARGIVHSCGGFIFSHDGDFYARPYKIYRKSRPGCSVTQLGLEIPSDDV